MSIDWLEPDATVRGSVVVVAGRGEGPAVYRRFTRRIAFDGYRVTVNSGAGAHIGGVLDAVDSAAADLPVVVIGSDTGALTALKAASYRPSVTGVVAAGLLVEAAADPSVAWLDELDARSACPVHRGVLDQPGNLERGTLAAAAEPATVDVVAQTSVPTLIVHGTNDVVSSSAAVQQVAASLPDARIILLDGGRHDILNDVSHRSVAAEIVQFLERLRLPGASDIVLRATAGALAR